MLIADKTILNMLSHTPLFSGMVPEEIVEALRNVPGGVQDFERGTILAHAGDSTEYSWLVLKGAVDILTSPNMDGSQQIIARIGPGEMYCEPFNLLSYNVVPISVEAASNVKVLKIDLREVLAANCRNSVARKLLANLAIQFAEKVVVFRNKTEILSQPTLELKILMTVKQYAEYQNTLSPYIPFSKVEWGNYLSANRNSVARCLQKLEDDGWLRIEGKHYTLLKTANIMFVQRSISSPQNMIHARVTQQENLQTISKRSGTLK